MVTSWKQDLETDRETAEAIVKKARSFAQELADIIGNAGLNDGLTPVQRLGYGNYGELLLTFLLVAQLCFQSHCHGGSLVSIYTDDLTFEI